MPRPRHPTTRQRAYSPRIGLLVCTYLAMGERLPDAAALAGLKSDLIVFQWLITEPDFAQIFDRAKEIRAHRIFESLRDLAATATNENAQAVRLRVDTDKWVLSKMLPRVYGDKLTTDVNVNMSLEQLVLDAIKLREIEAQPKQQHQPIMIEGTVAEVDERSRARNRRPGDSHKPAWLIEREMARAVADHGPAALHDSVSEANPAD